MNFLNFVGFNKNEKEDIKRIIKWIIISYILIGIGILIQFLFLKLEYSEFIIRVKTITLRGFVGYGIYVLIQEIVARGLLQQRLKKVTKSGFLEYIYYNTNILYMLFVF